jgi:hypothetical protein
LEKASIGQAVQDGVISPQTAAQMIDATEKQMGDLTKEKVPGSI